MGVFDWRKMMNVLLLYRSGQKMKVCSTGESIGKRLFFLKFAVGKKLTEIKIDVNVFE